MIKNDLKNYIITAIIAVILTTVSFIVSGILGTILLAYTAALVGYSVTKHHYACVVLLCGLIAAVFGLLGKSFMALLIALPVILCGISLGISYNLKFSQFKTLFVVTCVYVLYMVVNMKLSGLAVNFSSLLTEIISSAYPLYKGVISQTDYNSIASELLSVFLKFMPAFIIIFCMCYGILLLIAFKSVLKKSKSESSDYISFSQWHADKNFGISFLVLLGISLILPAENILADAVANVVLISSFIFFVFGFSLLAYILKTRAKKPTSGKIIAVVIIAVSVIFAGFPFMILSVMGVMDSFINYREKLKK